MPKCKYGFTPSLSCDNCSGTGEFTDSEPCHFCMSDAIRRGELDGVADNVEYKGGKPVYRFIAHFDPQAWIEDYAVSVDPEGEQKWDCTAAVAEYVQPDGTLGKPFRKNSGGWYLDNDDILKSDPAAPEWVREWQGPFTIMVRSVKEGE